MCSVQYVESKAERADDKVSHFWKGDKYFCTHPLPLNLHSQEVRINNHSILSLSYMYHSQSLELKSVLTNKTVSQNVHVFQSENNTHNTAFHIPCDFVKEIDSNHGEPNECRRRKPTADFSCFNVRTIK